MNQKKQKTSLFWLLPVALLFAVPLFTGCEPSEVTEVTTDSIAESDDFTSERTISVVYSSSGASVSGASNTYQTVTVSGNDVTIVNKGSENITFQLSGSASDGFFKVYNTSKMEIALDGLSLTNANGAAINIQGTTDSLSKAGKAYIVVSGTNSLCDGTSYSDTPSSEDEKGVIFSEGKLFFSGTGSLSITAKGGHGLASDDYIIFQSSPTITINSTSGHGVKCNDYILVQAGTLDISVSANMKKGFKSDSLIRFSGGTTTINITGGAAYDSEDSEYSGTSGVKADQRFEMNGGYLTITNSGTGGKGINCDGTASFTAGNVDITVTGNNFSQGSESVAAKGIKCDGAIAISGGTMVVTASKHEAIESKSTINITGGEVYAYSASDDAINAASHLTIEDGYVCAHSAGNDGLDANGNCYIKGGVVYAIGATSPEVAIDANSEGGYNFYLTGGTLIAIGGLENGSSLSQSCYSASSWSANTWYALTVGSTVYAFKTPSSGGTPLVVSGSSTPTLMSGVTVSGGQSYLNGMMNIGGSTSGGSSVSISSYTGGTGGNGGGGPGGGGPGGRWK